MTLRELKDEASRLFAKGKFHRSVAVLSEAIQLDPADPQLRLRHAEACRRAGLKSAAVASYRVAAELFVQLGHFPRAQAALKTALHVSPGDAAVEGALEHLRGLPRPSAKTLLEEAGHELKPADLLAQAAMEMEAARSVESFTPQVRRLSASELAFKPGPTSRWVVLKADSSIRVRFTKELPSPHGETVELESNTAETPLPPTH